MTKQRNENTALKRTTTWKIIHEVNSKKKLKINKVFQGKNSEVNRFKRLRGGKWGYIKQKRKGLKLKVRM